MHLKKATKEDLKTFFHLSQQKHIGQNLNPKTLDQFRYEFEQKSIIFLSVMSDDKVIGYVILVDEQTTNQVQLKRIIIDEQHLGSGKKVLALVEQHCVTKLDKYTIWLDVYADNHRATALYEKSKFIRYRKGIENAKEVWFYRKSLQIKTTS
jgi:ribosomal protein S18 acetylase RimI-like enzyme